MQQLDLIGKQFNHLKVLDFSHIDENGNSYWVCKCVHPNCTNDENVIVRGTSLTHNRSTMCLSCSNSKHKLSNTKFIAKWDYIRKKMNEGIHSEWQTPQEFIDAMYNDYNEGDRLVRLDKSKGFTYDNCEWRNKK